MFRWRPRPHAQRGSLVLARVSVFAPLASRYGSPPPWSARRARSARLTLGRALKAVFPPETSLIRHLGDTLATGESRSESEAVVEGVDGRPAHVSIVTAPLAGRSGAVTAAVAVLRDVTRLRQLE